MKYEAARRIPAESIMTSGFLTVRPHWSLDRLIHFFVEHRLARAPVTSATGHLLGMVSSTDLVRYRVRYYVLPVTRPRSAARGILDLETLCQIVSDEEVGAMRVRGEGRVVVEDLMSRLIIEVDASTPLPDVAQTMIQAHVHRVFVTRAGVLVGVISPMDILRSMNLPFD